MKKRYILLVCCLLIAMILAGCGASQSTGSIGDAQTASGADVSDQALTAYRDILKAAPAIEGEHAELEDASFGYEENAEMFGEHYDCFAISDIDRDGVPELIAQSIINFRWTTISVYTFSDGKAVLLKTSPDESAHGTFEQNSTANGAYITYICEEGHIHSLWRGTDPLGETVEEDRAYALDRTTLIATDCNTFENENAVYFSDIAKANTAENADAI